MALTSCLLSFAFSKWNSEINDESKMVLLYQTHTQDKEPNSVNWCLIFQFFKIFILSTIKLNFITIKDLYKCMICTNDVFYLSESDENSDEIDQNILANTEVCLFLKMFQTTVNIQIGALSLEKKLLINLVILYIILKKRRIFLVEKKSSYYFNMAFACKILIH